MSPSESVCLARSAAAGDAHAFDKLARHYRPLLFTCALSLSRDPALAEDAVQDALATAWQQIGRLREPERACAWLCGIVRNVIRERRRHASRHAPDAVAASMGGTSAGGISAEPSPVETLMAQKRRSVVWTEVARLPDRYRLPLLLHYGEEQTTREVATLLSLDEATVRKRLSRGRARLRRRFSQQALSVVPVSPGRLLTALSRWLFAGTPQSAAIFGGVVLAAVAVSQKPRVMPAGRTPSAQVVRHTSPRAGHLPDMKAKHAALVFALTTTATAATMTAVAVAERQAREPESRPAEVTPKRVKNYDFEGDHIRGDGILPSGESVIVPERVEHDSLIDVRESFVREIVASAWLL